MIKIQAFRLVGAIVLLKLLCLQDRMLQFLLWPFLRGFLVLSLLSPDHPTTPVIAFAFALDAAALSAGLVTRKCVLLLFIFKWCCQVGTLFKRRIEHRDRKLFVSFLFSSLHFLHEYFRKLPPPEQRSNSLQ